MQVANRVIFNTGILYAKIIICVFISLWSVPLVLHALGASDYGLYNLIAGVIAMLSFLNASMTVSLQRFMSVTMGEGNDEKLIKIYNTGIILHIFIGILLVCFLELCSIFIFDDFLNIPSERLRTAEIVYQFLVISMFFTVVSVPFDAVLNAEEDMLAFSIISIIEAVLKLGIAFCLMYISYDKLIFYGCTLVCIVILSTTMKFLYVKHKYEDFRISIKNGFNIPLSREMFGFIGWSALGGGAMVARNQGVAILLNLFFGTIINAAYGIANQISGVLSYFSVSLQKSLNPQLMKSEGMGNRERLLKLAFISSKYSVLLLGIFVVPLLIYMPSILHLWLTNVPEHTVLFSRLVLLLALLGQYSVGIQVLIQSVGKISSYFVTVSVLIFFGLFVAFWLLRMIKLPEMALYSFIGVEIILFAIRLLFAHKLAKLHINSFIKKVVLPTMAVSIGTFAACYFLSIVLGMSLVGMLLSIGITLLIFSLLAWFIALDSYEKVIIGNSLQSVISKLFKHNK